MSATTQATFPVSTDLTVGTRAVVVVTAGGKAFGKNVEFVKRLGAQFDPAGKVWVLRITEHNAEQARRFLVREDGHFTGYQVIDKAAWIARREQFAK